MAVEDSVAQDQLQSFVRRIEALDDEIAALNADKSEIFKESKASGFDNKIVRKVIAKRRLGALEREEQDTLFEMYWDAVHAPVKSLVRAHVENIEQFPVEHDANGVIPADDPLSAKPEGQAEPGNAGALVGAPVESEPAAISTPISQDAGSSSGRTMAFDAINAGSNPAPAATDDAKMKVLRPQCLRPSACGGQGRNHCWSCKKAMNEGGVA